MSAQLGGSSPQTGAQAVVANAVDPARRPDVLLRVRRDEGHEVSAWWMIGAFVGVSVAVILLLSFVPGGA
ncbi:UDP-N-acetylmuramyl pentapeptide phosphotransferase [Microbacterium sp. 2FI]|uniref:UDP-N-acetylmuramyl pentapeptide phosphotransferase n=1 Tax=Microbacterium sp. 2FI TaxID=2502193 RepID=UPI0010F6D629|nr:UDP-N-acetylmuramyl pentapeptide phosphotransferase [Microbacterium sp. 2FI]